MLLAVLCAYCDYLGAMGDSSFTPPMSFSHHALAQCITSPLLNGRNFAAWSRSLCLKCHVSNHNKHFYYYLFNSNVFLIKKI